MTAERTEQVRLLVVEDDADLADLYADWLSGAYRVETAYKGAEALELLDETIDVVLLDRMMPGRSGGEVLEEIRASGIECRVVMVSAVTPDLDVVQMGFDAYLEKPVDAATLREVVDRMCRRAEYDEKLQELFSLIERQDTLEAVKKPETLEASEEYRSLIDRLETVQDEVESLLTNLADDDFRVAVERLQRRAAERTGQRQYESLTEDVLDTSKEATVVIDADQTVVWANEATESLLGLDRDGVRGQPYDVIAAEQFTDIEAGEKSLVSLIRAGLAGRDEEFDAVVHVPGGTDRPERWLEYWSAPIETGLYAGGRIEHYHDITGRYRREQYLQTLHSATRELMGAETIGGVAEQAVTTATVDLEFSYAALFARDRETGDLVPAADETTDPAVDPTLPTLSGGPDPVWRVFSGQPESAVTSTDGGHDRDGGWLDDSFGDWVLCPLGQQGVFLAATTDEASLTVTKRNLAKTWAANTRQALERVVRNQDLRSRDRELRRQNEQLSRLDRINRLIRSIVPAVVSADTRTEVESEVCRRLLRLGPVTGAWVADIDLSTDETVCRASAGELDSYLARLTEATATADGNSPVGETPAVPAREAYNTRASVVVADLLSVESGPWWRERGLEQGTQAIVAVPIAHESTQFGALEIHVGRPQGIGDEEIEAIEELAVTIGHGVNTIRQRDALMAGGATALDFHIESASDLSRLAEVVDAPLAATDVLQQGDGTCAVFVTIDVGAKHDRDRILDQIRTETGASVLRDGDDALTCVVTLRADSSIRALVERGVTLQRIEIDSDTADLTVTVGLSHSVDVREYVDAVTDDLDGIELVAKYDGAKKEQSGSVASNQIDGQLTEKQREAVRMAFHAGYFDWPRSAGAESVATELGIAQSTFSQHLRTAERKLLAELFK